MTATITDLFAGFGGASHPGDQYVLLTLDDLNTGTDTDTTDSTDDSLERTPR